ncbi:MAG TPA: VWA domain-containing protein [Acidobacteriaceae bacterium]|nr:VWA domain-containing protein [Acidobacteriaceae bacterium]
MPSYAQSAAAEQSSPVSNGQSVNYTRRELQPNLEVDRDPVPSPDAADNLPVGAANHGKVIGKSGTSGYVLHENVNEVVLDCTVVDKNGRLASGLKQSDFRAWEDGVPQKIVSFQYGDVPVSVGILVDNSGSMRDKRETANRAAIELVRESNPQDRAFIVNFNNKAYLDQGFTSNISELERGLEHYDATGETALYDAVVASADELSAHAKWPKQVLLIITDGDDDASRLTLQQTVQRVQRLGGPVIYSIGMLFESESPQQAERARQTLETLSNDTGGMAFFPRSSQDMDTIAKEVARDIRDQYMIGYHSTKSPDLGGYRSVRVEAQSQHHHKLTVRTRNGYYPRQVHQMHAVQAAQKTK